ncbi:electron transport complex subunit RsxC [Oceanimonas sp. MB9]|uniref:electron transport complex subunit RsxC n=1 Tax=Oceanimonas sp. MB9 TaxID=2588453 RepID=UPI0013F5CDC6|nr:electron transport complex subunit RsxC [Oceanimonas sp. MB9]NHI01983.1 Electron transport complex subunit RsxC [Oceanimonas sp. MB9]
MSLLANLQAGKLHDFHGGIHPPERKAPANINPIVDAGLPDELVLQIRQHIGQPARLRVKVGSRVLKGERLTDADNPMMIPVHAPTSGTVVAIEHRPLCHPSGLDGECVIVAPDGKDEWRPRFPMSDIEALGADVLLERIHESGITGLGGAGFPAHVKLRPRKKAIETLIINAVECEPYISADDRLMREHAGDILHGVAILRQIVQPGLTVIAVEDNKPEALAALREANTSEQVLVVPVPTKYPSGGEKQLIEIITGQQVPHNGLPADIGIVVQNVGTAFAVKRAVIDDEPLIQRVVTIAGECFAEKCNAWVRIGTPVRYLLKRFGFTPGPEPRVIMGGPMMGFTLHTAAAPVIKGSNCVLAPSQHELSPPVEEQPCIRCSQCADACPASLLPQQLYWHARANEHDKLNSHNLFDCIECGACAWVCPSQIPLVQYYRVAKADIRQAQREAELAEHAKKRFEARQARLEREKVERQERQQKAAAERKARMAEQAAAGGEDPVAAALARVKARQQAESTDDMAAARAARKEEARRNRERKAAVAAAPATDDKSSAVAAAIARAKARKAAQTDTGSEVPASAAADDKKSAVAAAVARAKARKAAQQAEQGEPAETDAPVDDKKAAVAAAVARAKARKAAQQAEQNEPAEADAPVDDKKAAVAAAVARAKARKAAQQAEQSEPAEADAPADDKKAAVAAAVARAKARKAAQQAEQNEPAEADAPVDDKKAAVAAAIARAKARKAAKESEQVEGKDAPADDDKKAAIRAAVAKAKARRAAASNQSEPEDES